MNLPELLVIIIALLTAVFGLLFLLQPNLIPKLEQHLNRPWGEREIISLRLGLPAEDIFEDFANRPVLQKRLEWDHALLASPRITGIALCLCATLLYWLG